MCRIVLKNGFRKMFHFQNRTDKLICVRTSFTLPKKKIKMNGLAFYIARKHKIKTIKKGEKMKFAHRDAHFSI